MRTELNLILIAALALALITASATAESVYVINGAAQFGSVNLANGAFIPIGSGLPESGAGLVQGPGGKLLTIGGSGDLYSIDPTTGVTTDIGSTGLTLSTAPVNTIGELNGVVYVTDTNNNLYSINTTTAAAMLIGSTGMPGDPGCGMFPNLCDESLFGANGDLYATYDAFLLGNDGYSANILVNPGLWQIDPTTGAATFIASTDLHILSATDDNGEIIAFEGFPSATNPLPNPLVEAISLNLSTGATSEIVSLGTDTGPIFGVAPANTPEPASLALLGTGLAAIAARLRSVKLRR